MTTLVPVTTIELRGVSVEHDDVPVLADLDLVVPSGQVTALLGASGSGKTTVLRAIAGLVPLAAGRVLIGGTDVAGTPPRDRDLRYVPQDTPMSGAMDVAGNVAFPLTVRGVRREEAAERADRQGRRFGLRGLIGRRPSTLSGGERAAAGIARGTVEPPVGLLLDEAVAHLDPRAQAEVLRAIRAFHREHDVTVLFATNDVRVAEVISDTVAVIDRRRIVCSGPLPSVRRRPGTVLAADLLAPAPLTWLPAVVEDAVVYGEVAIATSHGVVHTSAPSLRDRRGPVLLGIGTRDGVLAPTGTGGLTGRVERVATTGDRRLVTLSVAGETLVVDSPADRWLPSVGEAADLDVRGGFVATTGGTVVASLG